MLNDWPRPLVIGHRGASAYAPENTLAAFELAIKHRADAIEFDVKLSSDHQVVVIHDPTVDRTTNGTGKVANLPLGVLKELDAGIKYSDKFTGERIPTLIDVFERFGKKILMNVELTNYSTPFDGLVKEVVELVKFYDLEDQILFSSFLEKNLNISRKLLPEVPCGLLAFSGWMGYFPRKSGWKRKFQALHPNIADVNQDLIAALHTAEKRINVWTVNGEENLRHMLDLKVDGIFTDDPGLLRRILEQNK
ncbi:MAG: glycerophosphodiester phosphodiesterase family protein [Chloroflexota bacterium]